MATPTDADAAERDAEARRQARRGNAAKWKLSAAKVVAKMPPAGADTPGLAPMQRLAKTVVAARLDASAHAIMSDHRRQLEEQSMQLMQVQQRLREAEAASVTSNQMQMVIKAHGVEEAGTMLRQATREQRKTREEVATMRDWVRSELGKGSHTRHVVEMIAAKEKASKHQFDRMEERIIEVRHGMSSLRDIETRLRTKLAETTQLSNRLLSLSVAGLDLGPTVAQLKPTQGHEILVVVKALGARVLKNEKQAEAQRRKLMTDIRGAEGRCLKSLRAALRRHCPQCDELYERGETGDWEGAHRLAYGQHWHEDMPKAEAVGRNGAHAHQLRHDRAVIDDGTLVRTNPEQDARLRAALQVDATATFESLEDRLMKLLEYIDDHGGVSGASGGHSASAGTATAQDIANSGAVQANASAVTKLSRKLRELEAVQDQERARSDAMASRLGGLSEQVQALQGKQGDIQERVARLERTLADLKGSILDELVARLESDDADSPLGRLKTWATSTFARRYVEDHVQKLAEAAQHMRTMITTNATDLASQVARIHEELLNLAEYNHGLVFELQRTQWLARESLAKQAHGPVSDWNVRSGEQRAVGIRANRVFNDSRGFPPAHHAEPVDDGTEEGKDSEDEEQDSDGDVQPDDKSDFGHNQHDPPRDHPSPIRTSTSAFFASTGSPTFRRAAASGTTSSPVPQAPVSSTGRSSIAVSRAALPKHDEARGPATRSALGSTGTASPKSVVSGTKPAVSDTGSPKSVVSGTKPAVSDTGSPKPVVSGMASPKPAVSGTASPGFAPSSGASSSRQGEVGDSTRPRSPTRLFPSPATSSRRVALADERLTVSSPLPSRPRPSSAKALLGHRKAVMIVGSPASAASVWTGAAAHQRPQSAHPERRVRTGTASNVLPAGSATQQHHQRPSSAARQRRQRPSSAALQPRQRPASAALQPRQRPASSVRQPRQRPSSSVRQHDLRSSSSAGQRTQSARPSSAARWRQQRRSSGSSHSHNAQYNIGVRRARSSSAVGLRANFVNSATPIGHLRRARSASHGSAAGGGRAAVIASRRSRPQAAEPAVRERQPASSTFDSFVDTASGSGWLPKDADGFVDSVLATVRDGVPGHAPGQTAAHAPAADSPTGRRDAQHPEPGRAAEADEDEEDWRKYREVSSSATVVRVGRAGDGGGGSSLAKRRRRAKKKRQSGHDEFRAWTPRMHTTSPIPQ